MCDYECEHWCILETECLLLFSDELGIPINPRRGNGKFL